VLLFRGEDARPPWGADYYQNMMLWALPAAVSETDLTDPCEPGGLANRIIEAAQARGGWPPGQPQPEPTHCGPCNPTTG
jgi:hypothetical protein